MVYREIAPIERLRPWIHCYWVLEGCETGPQVIYPDGRPEIVFHYGDTFIHGGREQPRGLYVGQLTSPVTVQSEGRAGVFGIRFTPAGGWAFARFPQTEAAGHIASLADVCGAFGCNLTERVLNASSTCDRVRLVERVLAKRVPEHASGVDLLATAVAEGHLLSREARIQSGYSDRAWERIFRERTGLRPKMLERIGRFRRAMLLAAEGSSWVDVAARCNYTDQAHMIRDFREFTGTPPTQTDRDLFT